MESIKKERKLLQSEWKLFEQKVCSKCNIDLSLPTFYFMCGHVFHENCTQESEGLKVCWICDPDFKHFASFNLSKVDRNAEQRAKEDQIL